MGLGHLGVGRLWPGVGHRAKRLEQRAGGGAAFSAGGAGQAIMTDFGETFGQDMLDKALEKLGGGQLDVLDLLGSIVAVAKGDLTVFNLFQPRVSDGDAEDVTAQVVQHFVPAAGRLGVDDPFFFPELGRNLVQ